MATGFTQQGVQIEAPPVTNFTILEHCFNFDFYNKGHNLQLKMVLKGKAFGLITNGPYQMFPSYCHEYTSQIKLSFAKLIPSSAQVLFL